MTRLAVRTDGAHGRNTRVVMDGHDVSAFLTGLTLNIDVNDVNRATLTAVALHVEDFEAEAEVRCIVMFGPYTGRGKTMADALHDMVAKYDRAQEAEAGP